MAQNQLVKFQEEQADGTRIFTITEDDLNWLLTLSKNQLESDMSAMGNDPLAKTFEGYVNRVSDCIDFVNSEEI